MRNIAIVISILLILSSCNCMKNKKSDKSIPSYAVQQTTVYKTIADFNNLVPITMNENRTEITSYPAPSDVIINGKLTTPTQLKNGYLLDNRGITANTVFLKYTYENYSKLENAPSLEEMMGNIAEKHPLSELIDCGPRSQFKDEVKEINSLIDNNFPSCKKTNITPMQVEF